MPIYEYACQQCGHEMEVLQKMSDDPLADCPECQTSSLKKKISASAFRLKGGGWYETDFKTGDKKNLSQTDASKSASASDAPKGAGKSSEAKPSVSSETGSSTSNNSASSSSGNSKATASSGNSSSGSSTTT